MYIKTWTEPNKWFSNFESPGKDSKIENIKEPIRGQKESNMVVQ